MSHDAMPMMPCRYKMLIDTLEGLNNSNTPLVAQVEGSYQVAGVTDDPGIYYFIPWLAKTFSISIDSAIPVFFGFLLIMGALISTLCFCLAFKNWAGRLIVTLAMFTGALLGCRSSDVYVTFYFAVASILPVYILYSRKKCGLTSKIIFSLVFSGIILGYCNFIRGHSGSGVLLFLLFWIFLNRDFSFLNKLVSTAVLFAATSLPYLHFYTLETNRDQYIAQVNQEHNSVNVVHPKWHSIYLGLGYVENNYGLEYDDRIAFDKVQSINPNIGYCTKEYEDVLKKECIMLAKKDFLFILKNLFTKAYYILLRLLTFSNIGLILFFYVKPSMRSVFPILVAIAFYSLPGILVIPLNAYLLGMTTTTTIFGLYMICSSLEKYERTKRALKERQTTSPSF